MRQSVSKCCSWHSLHSPRAAKTKAVHEPFVAATPATYRDISRHVAALSEFGLRFLNGRRRSVNRKVQGSSPRPGATFEYESECVVDDRLTAVQQRYGNLDSNTRLLRAALETVPNSVSAPRCGDASAERATGHQHVLRWKHANRQVRFRHHPHRRRDLRA